jgi:hypothetical protein
MSSWIFQGNPARYDMDEYLSRYSYIYWSAPTNQKEIFIGDRAFIWRAGANAGVVAVGIIREIPTPRDNVKKKEALGDDLWIDSDKQKEELVVGIEIEEIRLSAEEGMIERDAIKKRSDFFKNRIITHPVGTVFRLTPEELSFLLGLWGNNYEENIIIIEATEGALQLKSHYRRERSRKLVSLKKGQYKKAQGTLNCEICGFSFEGVYPHTLGDNFIEVHHKIPLSKIHQTIKTTLNDLLLVCANCHRMIHRTKDAENNLAALFAHFKNSP